MSAGPLDSGRRKDEEEVSPLLSSSLGREKERVSGDFLLGLSCGLYLGEGTLTLGQVDATPVLKVNLRRTTTPCLPRGSRRKESG